MILFNTFNFLNNSPRFIGIIVMFLMFYINFVNCEECYDRTVSGFTEQFKYLKNCTIIKGSLKIVLLEENKAEDYERWVFPELKEITGFLLLYRPLELRTIGQLFPNLALIRGQHLFLSYSLIIAEASDMTQIDLPNLIEIQRGRVMVMRSPKLCYYDTIDWSAICKNTEDKECLETLGDKNVKKNCPTSCADNCIPEHCWSAKHCQKFVHENAVRPGFINCHENCLGGSCYNSSANGCVLCKGPSHNGYCLSPGEKCPENTYLYEEIQRCVDKNVCKMRKHYIYQDSCLQHCPPEHSEFNYETNSEIKFECFPCRIRCPKVCKSSQILTMSDSTSLRGCTVINGSLYIRIRLDVRMEELQKNLGLIEEIKGFLKIYNSMGISSLSFLRSLQRIRGEELEYGFYGLVVYNNENLQSLWNWNEKRSLEIMNGSIFFHTNNRLCTKEILKLAQITKYNNSRDFIPKPAHEHSCDPTIMNSGSKVLSKDTVRIWWQQLERNDADKLEYLIHYIQSSRVDAEKYISRDGCIENSWIVLLVNAKDLLKGDNNYVLYDLTDLKPNTQYAYFTKLYETPENAGLNARTDILDFITDPDIPTAPILYVVQKTFNSITVSWRSISLDPDLIEYYQIDVTEQPDKKEILDTRNYCLEPFDRTEEDHSGKANDKNCCEDKQPNIDAGRKLPVQNLPERESENEFHDRFHRSIMEKTGKKPKDQSQHDPSRYIISDEFQADEEMYTLKGLQPYRLYTIFFFACNKKAGCGSYSMFSTRSGKSVNADQIRLKIVLGSQELGNLYLLWPEPKYINGLILAYEVVQRKHFPDDETADSATCITRLQHEKSNFNFTVTDLDYTTYQFRVRAMSLAGFARFSEWKVVSHGKRPAEENHPLRNVVFIGLGAVSLTTLVLFGWHGYKKWFERRQTEDVDILLHEMVEQAQDPPEFGRYLECEDSLENETNLHED